MISGKYKIVRLLKLSAASMLLASAFCFAAESNYEQSAADADEQTGQDKADTLREVAENWIQVGISQFKRGLYEQAEQSFLKARELMEYLPAKQHKDLEERLNRTKTAIAEKNAAVAALQKAKDLLNQGRPVEARVYFENARNSPCLTEQQREQIEDELKKVDNSSDRQKKEITDLYNRSVELFRAGEFEKAREGFAQVARYGLLVTPAGQTPEDYLIQIDNILTERIKSESPARTPPLLPQTPEKPALPATNTVDNSNISELDLLRFPPEQSAVSRVEPNDSNQRPQNTQKEIAEVASVAEPAIVETPQTGIAPEPPAAGAVEPNAKANIIRTYTKAVVENAELRVQSYISRGEFDRAVTAIHNAANVVSENRYVIGDELFLQYSIRLKRLADKIIEARKSPQR